MAKLQSSHSSPILIINQFIVWKGTSMISSHSSLPLILNVIWSADFVVIVVVAAAAVVAVAAAARTSFSVIATSFVFVWIPPCRTRSCFRYTPQFSFHLQVTKRGRFSMKLRKRWNKLTVKCSKCRAVQCNCVSRRNRKSCQTLSQNFLKISERDKNESSGWDPSNS